MTTYWGVDTEGNDRASPSVAPGAHTLFPPRIYQRESDGMTVVPRRLFAVRHFDYKPGEHVVFGGPSKKGKTQLAFDLLGPLASPDFPAYIAVSKPTDPVTLEHGKLYGYRFVQDWPVSKQIKEWFVGSPSGYVVWPKFGNVNNDFPNAAAITARLLGDTYTASARNEKHHSAGILVMDDTMVKAKIMGLDNQMITILAMAGAMKLGMWVFVQKPTDSGKTTLWAYENGDHYFFTKGGDNRMLRRYQEIAGDRSHIVRAVVPTLERYQFLYMHDDDICIVDAVPESNLTVSTSREG